MDSCENYLIQEKESIEAMMWMWAEFARTGALVYVTGLTLPSSDPGPRVIQLSDKFSGEDFLTLCQPAPGQLETIVSGDLRAIIIDA